MAPPIRVRFTRRPALPHRTLGWDARLWLVILLLYPLMVTHGATSVPEVMNYQGSLHSEGQALSGSYALKFTIYDAATAGNSLWSETQTVTVANGLFSIMLGSVNPLGAAIFDGPDRWLAIAIGADSDMTPRQRLSTTPYAFRAAQAQYVAAGTTMSGNATNGIMVVLFGGEPIQGPHEEIVPGTAIVGKTRSTADGAAGVFGIASAATGETVGIRGESWSTKGIGVMGRAAAEGESAGGTGVCGETAGEFGSGVSGVATSSKGNSSGGIFTSMGVNGVGVRAAAASDHGSTCGGEFSCLSPDGVGVIGLAMATTGNAYGGKFETYSFDTAAAAVLGKTETAASGGRFESSSGAGIKVKSGTGNIIEGYNASQLAFKVDNKGNVFADGSYQSPAADFAEMLPGTPGLEPGDVLAVGPDGKIMRAGGDNAHAVIGVYSTRPAFLGGAASATSKATASVPVAIVGIVPVKATAENGPIHPNDSLGVSQTKEGYAAKAIPVFATGDGQAVYAGGTLVGRAIESLDQGEGVIQILVQLR